MKTRTELIISLQNEVDLCFEAKKTRDNDGPPYMTLVNLFLSPITSQTLLNLFACLKLVCFLFEFICSCILVTNSLTKPIKVQL